MATIAEVSAVQLMCHFLEELPRFVRTLEKPRIHRARISTSTSELTLKRPNDVIESAHRNAYSDEVLHFLTGSSIALESLLNEVSCAKALEPEFGLSALMTAYPKVVQLVVELVVNPLPLVSPAAVHSLLLILEKFDRTAGLLDEALLNPSADKLARLHSSKLVSSSGESMRWKSLQLAMKVQTYIERLCERSRVPSGAVVFERGDVSSISVMGIALIGLPESSSAVTALLDAISLVKTSDRIPFWPFFGCLERYTRQHDIEDDKVRLRLWELCEPSFHKVAFRVIESAVFLDLPQPTWDGLVADSIRSPTLFRSLMQLLKTIYWNVNGCPRVLNLARTLRSKLAVDESAEMACEYFSDEERLLECWIATGVNVDGHAPECSSFYMQCVCQECETVLAGNAHGLNTLRWVCLLHPEWLRAWLGTIFTVSCPKLRQRCLVLVSLIFVLNPAQDWFLRFGDIRSEALQAALRIS